MNEQERELDFMVGELEHENRLVRARNGRLEAEVTVLTEMVRVLSDKLAEMEAKQEQDEPVAWMNSKRDMTYTHGPYNADDIPLYTTPQQRKPLTDEQIKDVASSCMWWVREQDILDDAIELDRAIEAAHGIAQQGSDK
jgi:hypothetical protein